MSDQSLGLQDEEFWTNPTRTADDVVADLMDQRFNGVWIGAPTAVPIDLRTTLPALAFRAGTITDQWRVPFDEHGIWVAVNVEANHTQAAFAGNLEVERVKQDPSTAPSGFAVERKPFELRQLLDLLWEPGRYLVNIVMRERTSNRADITLKQSPRKYDDPEVVKFLASKKATPVPPVVFPESADPLPCYQKLDGSPPIPEEPGLALTADRVLVFTADAQVILRGSFRLPARPHEIVPPVVPAAGTPTPAGAGSKPTAIIGIAVLVTGAEIPATSLTQIKVPSFDPIPPDAKNAVVTGYFTLDLRQLKIVPDQSQTLFVYAFSGDVMVGPIPIALVSEKMIPK